MEAKSYDKMLKRISGGEVPSDKLEVLYANAEKIGDEQAQSIMIHILKYAQFEDTILYKKLVPESAINRKKFMEDEGFTCANWTWSWSFINHDKKIIAFGAWNIKYLDENNVVILNELWKGDKRTSLGYNQALKHIEIADNQNYSYQVFNMIHGGNDSNGRSKIAGIEPVLKNAILRKDDKCWIAKVS